MRAITAICFLIPVALVLQCTKNDLFLASRGSRALGIDVQGLAQGATQATAATAAKSVGADVVSFGVDWNTVEISPGMGTTPGTYSDPGGVLATANNLYPGQGLRVSLTIRASNASGNLIPSDIGGTTYDDPNLQSRFNQLVDFILTQLPAVTFTSIQIGNEVDLHPLGNTTVFWNQYGAFLNEVVPYVHAAHPGIKVGITVSASAFSAAGVNGVFAQAGVTAMLPFIDVLGVTYFPVNADYTVKDIPSVISDIDALTAAASPTPLYFQQVGYPTSRAIGGSEAGQVSFIDAIFTAWDRHPTQIPVLILSRLYDWDPAIATAASGATPYVFGAAANYAEFVRTLGLRTFDAPSTDKPALAEIQIQTGRRSWAGH